MNPKEFLLLFVGGGLFISLGDRVHIAYGVLTQADTSFFGQAWWVMPNFGCVSIALYFGYGFLRKLNGEEVSNFSSRRLLTTSCAFLLAYASTGPLDAWGWWLAALLSIWWLLRIIIWPVRKSVIQFVVILAFVGPLAEAFQSSTGLFAYDHPDLGLVPSWLFAIYLHGALVVPEVEALIRGRKERNPHL